MFLVSEQDGRPQTIWNEKGSRGSCSNIKTLPRPVTKVQGILSLPIPKAGMSTNIPIPLARPRQEQMLSATLGEMSQNAPLKQSRWLKNSIVEQTNVNPTFRGFAYKNYQPVSQANQSHAGANQVNSSPH